MEGRNKDRQRLIYLLKVTNAEDGSFLGQVADITSTGIMLVCPDPLETGEDYELSIEMPREMDAVADLNLKAQCKWCKTDEDPRFYSCGFAFSGLRPREEKLIRALIDDFLYEEPEEEDVFPEDVQ